MAAVTLLCIYLNLTFPIDRSTIPKESTMAVGKGAEDIFGAKKTVEEEAKGQHAKLGARAKNTAALARLEISMIILILAQNINSTELI